MTAFRQLPGYLLALVYLAMSVVAPSVLHCHDHHPHQAVALGDHVALCGTQSCGGHHHAHDAPEPRQTHSHDSVGSHDHEPCHTLDGPSHMRAADNLVAAERGELPDLPPADLTGESIAPPALLPPREDRRCVARARAPPPRPPRLQRPATLLL